MYLKKYKCLYICIYFFGTLNMMHLKSYLEKTLMNFLWGLTKKTNSILYSPTNAILTLSKSSGCWHFWLELESWYGNHSQQLQHSFLLGPLLQFPQKLLIACDLLLLYCVKSINGTMEFLRIQMKPRLIFWIMIGFLSSSFDWMIRWKYLLSFMDSWNQMRLSSQQMIMIL